MSGDCSTSPTESAPRPDRATASTCFRRASASATLVRATTSCELSSVICAVVRLTSSLPRMRPFSRRKSSTAFSEISTLRVTSESRSLSHAAARWVASNLTSS